MTRALVVTKPGDSSVLEVQDVATPPPGDGQVQVRIAAVGVNFIDVYKRQGVYPMETPFVLGEEGAGIVTAVGAGADEAAVGDRVAWAGQAGSAAELANVSAAEAVPVPDGLDLDVAAAAMLQGMTAHYLVNSTWPVQPGQIALVHAAAGGVGQLLVQLINRKGATVVATAGSDEKLQIAKELGAAQLTNYRTFSGDAPADEVRRLADRGVGVLLVEHNFNLIRELAEHVVVLKDGAVLLEGTPPDIVKRLNAAIADALRSPDVKQRIEADGSSVLGGTPEALSRTIVAEIAKWSSVIKRAGIKPPPS